MSLKNFWVWKVLGIKYLRSTKISGKKFWGLNKFWVQKDLGPEKRMGSEKICDLNKNWLKKCRLLKNLGSKKLWPEIL